MTEHDARLLPAALASLASCAVAATTKQWDAVAALWCTAAGLAIAGAATLRFLCRESRRVRWRRVAGVSMAFAFACALTAAVTLTAAARWHRDVPEWARDPDGGSRVSVEGTVVSDPREAGRDAWTGESRWSVTVDAGWACEAPCAQMSAVRMSIDAVVEGGPRPTLGDRVHVEGDPGATRDTRRAVTLWDAKVTVVGEPDPVLAAVAAVRDHAREAARGLPADVRGLTLGMTIGDTDQVPADLEDDMRVTGLTHLTAVSGSHFAIVTLVAGWVLRRTVRARAARALLLATGMCALAALVLPEPSVLRAVTMSLAVALGWWWGRPARAIPALSAGILTLLLAEPGLAGAVGLQLSVVAVIAIVVWSPRLAVVLARWVIAPMARLVAVPLAAWLACWPLLVMLRPGMGPYAVAANIVAAVAAFPVTVLGLAGTLASLAWPPLGAALMEVAGFCAWPVTWSARAFASAPGAWTPWPGGIGGVALAAGVTACLVVATATDRLRQAARLAAALIAVVITGASPMWTVTLRPAMEDWRVVVCDVGQGDMMLVRVDAGSAVVVDTGPPGGAGAACLERYRVTEIPLLVLTHPHADHDGAVAELASIAPIESTWVSPAALEAGHDVGALDAAELGIPVSSATRGQEWSRGDVSVNVLHPQIAGTSASSSSDINDASLALWIQAGGVTVLALGDLEADGQRSLARGLAGPVLVDLVKVAHHGSGTQGEELAGLITARVAAISVGEGNSYGHPAPETVSLYDQRALAVLTTAACGDIALGDDASVASLCPASVAG